MSKLTFVWEQKRTIQNVRTQHFIWPSAWAYCVWPLKCSLSFAFVHATLHKYGSAYLEKYFKQDTQQLHKFNIHISILCS